MYNPRPSLQGPFHASLTIPERPGPGGGRRGPFLLKKKHHFPISHVILTHGREGRLCACTPSTGNTHTPQSAFLMTAKPRENRPVGHKSPWSYVFQGRLQICLGSGHIPMEGKTGAEIDQACLSQAGQTHKSEQGLRPSQNGIMISDTQHLGRQKNTGAWEPSTFWIMILCSGTEFQSRKNASPSDIPRLCMECGIARRQVEGRRRRKVLTSL